MGGVKKDIYSAERAFKGLTFSDVNVVRLLMEYRYKYDMYAGFESNSSFDVAGMISSVNAEVIVTFAALDELIEKCQFDETQMKIIKMAEDGFTLKEAAKMIGLSDSDNIKKRMNKICRDIVKMNLWDWRKMTYGDTLRLKSKTCSKCRDELPATFEFFSDNSDAKDGFHSICKQCRK